MEVRFRIPEGEDVMATVDHGEELARLRTQVEELQRTVAALAAAHRAAEGSSTSGTESRARFQEIEVERIDVVEPDGTIRLAISNNARFPEPIVQGKVGKRSGSPLAGLILYNDDGDECGGLYGYGRTAEDGTYSAGGGLNLDQYRPQEQVVGINYQGQNGRNTAGMRVWERVHGAPVQFPNQEAIDASLIGRPYATRVFVGRTSEGAAVVRLCDAGGRVRLRLAVDAAGTPALQFFDEHGGVVYRLPGAAPHEGHAQADPQGTQRQP
jgi:hypothetical protein